LDFLDHPEEKENVADLLNWWNWYTIHAYLQGPAKLILRFL